MATMSRGKVSAFYNEFPSLRRVVRPSRVEWISVSRITRETAVESEYGRLFVFDNHGELITKSRLWENMEQAILRAGGQDCVSFVVEKRFPRGSGGGGFSCPGWLAFLMGEGYTLTIHKLPKDFRIDDLQAERAAIEAAEAHWEIEHT